MIPNYVKAVIWSYDSKKLNLKNNKKAIVSHVLNYGSEKATKWLFKQYGKKTLHQIASQIPLGEWDKKSLALWGVILDIKPKSKSELIKGR